MPRSFSSGALSISSKLRASALPFSASTLVMAAVGVVLPWSMWPMVPTFTCGLLRSNFSLAMSSTPLRFYSLVAAHPSAFAFRFGGQRGSLRGQPFLLQPAHLLAKVGLPSEARCSPFAQRAKDGADDQD